MSKITILVCGAGSSAQVIAGLAASRENIESRVLSLFEDEAERFTNALKEGDLTLSINEGEDEPRIIKCKPRVVTKDPSRAVKGANFIILTVSPGEQEEYLQAIAPHLENDTTVVGFPGHAGFEFLCLGTLKAKVKRCAVISFESMPYASRIREFGRNVAVLGINEIVRGTMVKGKSKQPYDPFSVLQQVLGEFPILERYSNYLEPLLATSTVVNPAIMFGKWRDWDGTPLDSKPLFYQGITEQDAKFLTGISEECVEIAQAITKKNPKIELSWVIPLYELFMEEFMDNAEDSSNLLNLMKTNSAYDGVFHPMTPTEDGKFVPDFSSRYLTEDVPRGLAISKGIGLLAGVKTVLHDKVLEWCQEKMGKEYLVRRNMKGKDIGETRCPQRFGLETLDDLLNMV
ncbi:opine dehydrogenase-like [Haliotis rufescens]|uniref:opine dehydrogenase-like n=1 Tax=Haliotis rufescens TaxID=6454 RepID=UPI001EB08253|nr:opine dehydrogenase-like [Haliotis rufescens]